MAKSDYQNSEYWEGRIAEETWKTYNLAEEKNIDLIKMYDKASQSIKKEMYALAEMAEEQNGMTRTQQHRFNKLLGQQGHIYKEIEKLGDEVEKKATDQMYKSGKSVYGNVREALGETDFSMLNKKEMEQMLRSPWHGSFFSERLWKDNAKLERNLNGIINDGMASGRTVTEMAVQLSNIMNQAFNNAHRLVRTETINYMNRSAIRGYKDAGVDKVQWWAAEDERTCETCGSNHEKEYDIDKAPILPCHPGCRCTWLPVIEEGKTLNKLSGDIDKPKKSGTIKVDEKDSYKNFNELEKYLDSKYEISIDESVKSLDFQKCKEVVIGIESLFDEFEELKINIKKLSTRKSGVMCCDGSTICFNPDYFREEYELDKICVKQASLGNWIKNASVGSVGVHETGHAVEQVLIDLNKSYEYDFQKTLAWSDGSEAKAIVKQAVKNIKKTPYGKGKNKVELERAISEYAATDESEAMAESFGDVFANGDNANPLSKEIKKLVVEKYKLYKGE